jgi:hypothetical protein
VVTVETTGTEADVVAVAGGLTAVTFVVVMTVVLGVVVADGAGVMSGVDTATGSGAGVETVVVAVAGGVTVVTVTGAVGVVTVTGCVLPDDFCELDDVESCLCPPLRDAWKPCIAAAMNESELGFMLPISMLAFWEPYTTIQSTPTAPKNASALFRRRFSFSLIMFFSICIFL